MAAGGYQLEPILPASLQPRTPHLHGYFLHSLSQAFGFRLQRKTLMAVLPRPAVQMDRWFFGGWFQKGVNHNWCDLFFVCFVFFVLKYSFVLVSPHVVQTKHTGEHMFSCESIIHC